MLGADITRREIVVRVRADAWQQAAEACRRRLGFDHFGFLSGLDWTDSPLQTTRYENVWGTVEDEDAPDEDSTGEGGAGEDAGTAATDTAPPDVPSGYTTGLAGGETRFQVFARFYSTTEHRGITIKTDLDEADPRVPTISRVYGGADWNERETWEMFGFTFDGHPNLAHIYLPGGFEGHPLRKDFPLLAREVKPWPGLTNVEPIAGEGDGEEASEG